MTGEKETPDANQRMSQIRQERDSFKALLLVLSESENTELAILERQLKDAEDREARLRQALVALADLYHGPGGAHASRSLNDCRAPSCSIIREAFARDQRRTPAQP